jgi:RNA polymerase sigma-70 factor, ECF subfamily
MLTSEQIWREQRGALLSFIRRRVGSDDLAEDLVQEVFVRIHAQLPSLQNSARLQSWVYQIARHVVIDHHRTHKPAESLPPDFDLSVGEPEPAELILRSAENWLPSLVDCLPDGYREAVHLADLQEVPLAEVARHQGLSLSGAKSRVQRGRAKLKDLLLECCLLEFDHRGRIKDCAPKAACTCL